MFDEALEWELFKKNNDLHILNSMWKWQKSTQQDIWHGFTYSTKET